MSVVSLYFLLFSFWQTRQLFIAILYTFVPHAIQAIQIDLGIEVIPLAGLYMPKREWGPTQTPGFFT